MTVPYRQWSGPDLAAELARQGDTPSLALAGEVRGRTGIWFDTETRTWRGTGSAVIARGLVELVLRRTERKRA